MDLFETIGFCIALLFAFLFVFIILSFLGIDLDSPQKEKVYIVEVKNIEYINEI